jgi:hypothetical protein
VSHSRRGFIGGLISGAGALIVGRKIDAAPVETIAPVVQKDPWNIPSDGDDLPDDICGECGGAKGFCACIEETGSCKCGRRELKNLTFDVTDYIRCKDCGLPVPSGQPSIS